MNTNNSQNILSKIILRELYLNKINKKINKSINLINKLDYDLISTFSLKGGANVPELLRKINEVITNLEVTDNIRSELSNRISILFKVLPTDVINSDTVRKQLDELTKEKKLLVGENEVLVRENEVLVGEKTELNKK